MFSRVLKGQMKLVRAITWTTFLMLIMSLAFGVYRVFSGIGGWDFNPKGECWDWNVSIMAASVMADFAIFTVFSIIGFLLLMSSRKNGDAYPAVSALMASLCGATAATFLVSIATVWYPLYWTQIIVKLIASANSFIVAYAILKGYFDPKVTLAAVSILIRNYSNRLPVGEAEAREILDRLANDIDKLPELQDVMDDREERSRDFVSEELRENLRNISKALTQLPTIAAQAAEAAAADKLQAHRIEELHYQMSDLKTIVVGLDRTIRGNGAPGLTERVRVIEESIKGMITNAREHKSAAFAVKLALFTSFLALIGSAISAAVSWLVR